MPVYFSFQLFEKKIFKMGGAEKPVEVRGIVNGSPVTETALHSLTC